MEEKELKQKQEELKTKQKPEDKIEINKLKAMAYDIIEQIEKVNLFIQQEKQKLQQINNQIENLEIKNQNDRNRISKQWYRDWIR